MTNSRRRESPCLCVNYLISATISFTVSVVFNYLASMRYVFTPASSVSATMRP